MVMVKPALPYLDVIRRVKDETRLPVAAYNVSGEYAMIKAASAAGMLDERAAVLEALTSIRRAGADIVITYHAKDAARWLRDPDTQDPLAQARRRDRARRVRQAPAQPDAGRVPDRRSARTPRSPTALGVDEDVVLRARPASCSTSASSARSRRSSTRARSATARCSSRPRSTPSTRGGPAKIINSHPGVSHNYLRNHEFNMWFTIAVEEDSKLGLAGHARRAARS